MTGRSPVAGHPGHRLERAVVPQGVALLAAGSLLAALGLSACGPDAAKAATVLHGPRATSVQLADGTSRAATDGMTVPKGATVRTEPGGSAALVAAGRTVLLGSTSAVTVVDGQHEQLRAGLVMIDARRAPGLTLDAGAATVSTPRGTLARVERGALLRAASYRGPLQVRATGRKAEAGVTGLHQVQVPDGGLPGAATPLTLTRDAWERRYALDLVTADIDLSALADGLDRDPASGTAALQAVPATYSSAVPRAAGEPRSEPALAYVLARTGRSGDRVLSTYRQVRTLRADGGSWGVVAALVGTDVAAVGATLDALLNPASGPALAGGPAVVPVVPGGAVSGRGPTTTSGGTPSRAPSGSGGRPRPRPSPSSSPDPVQNVVKTVTGLLPTPTPTPLLGLPAASPSPVVSVQVGGLGVTVGG